MAITQRCATRHLKAVIRVGGIADSAPCQTQNSDHGHLISRRPLGQWNVIGASPSLRSNLLPAVERHPVDLGPQLGGFHRGEGVLLGGISDTIYPRGDAGREVPEREGI